MPTQEIKSIWERSAKCSDLSLSITLRFIFSSITKARVACIQCLNVHFTLKWGGEGSLFLKTHHLKVKAGFVIPFLYVGSASGEIRRLLLCPVSPCLSESGVSGTDRVQREGWGVEWVVQDYLAPRQQGQDCHHFLSRLMCWGWVLHARCSTVPREHSLWGWCHQDWHSAPNSWGPLRDGPLEVSSCFHASGKVGKNKTFKNLSEKKFRSGGKYEGNARARFLWSFLWKTFW